MSDFDLTVLAAKAFGARHKVAKRKQHVLAHHRDYVNGVDYWFQWAPLTSNDEAFRLAVKLNLLLMPYPDDNAVRVTRLDQPDTIVSWGTPPDALAATRRAIVRAAAEIGASK